MCLKELRDEFLYDCECRHLAKGSLRNYRASTRFLLEFLERKQITELEDARPRHLRDLMKEKQDAGNTPRYILMLCPLTLLHEDLEKRRRAEYLMVFGDDSEEGWDLYKEVLTVITYQKLEQLCKGDASDHKRNENRNKTFWTLIKQ